MFSKILKNDDMGSYFDECSHKLSVKAPKYTIESFPSEPTQFQVIFNFSGWRSHHKRFLSSQNPTRTVSTEGVITPLPIKSIQFNLQTITSTKEKKMFNALKRGLVGYRLSVDVRERLAKFAAETAWDILVSSMSPSNNRLNLNIHFKAVYQHVLYPSNRVMQESMESAGPAMIPSSEASIESLKRKIIDPLNENRASCSICLEDLDAGCEGVWMPCSHMFHGGCIKRWLRTSHYCPVCRFKMPTKPEK